MNACLVRRSSDLLVLNVTYSLAAHTATRFLRGCASFTLVSAPPCTAPTI